MSLPEKRHTKVSTNVAGLGTLASSHPFTQQVDVIFPSECVELEGCLSRLGARYARGRVNLADVFVASPTFVPPPPQTGSSEDIKQEDDPGSSVSASSPSNSILALSGNNDDPWCIDSRGILTLCVRKETYERLGLVGQKLPFKHRAGERYVISLPLNKVAGSLIMQSRCRSALESWDMNLKGPNPNSGPSSMGAWDIAYCSTVEGGEQDYLEQWAALVPVSAAKVRSVTCEKQHLQDVWVPNPSTMPPRPYSHQKEELEDWNHDVLSLLEWIGMAGLGAQRLKANDRIDPFVALYEPPSSSKVGNVSHLRWKGLLSPSFVQSVIDSSVAYLNRTNTPPLPESDPFVAIVVHGITNSPVVYLPPPQSSRSEPRVKDPPAHLPRVDGEDGWCLILTPGVRDAKEDVRSILVESVDQWDARWG